jgi:hypothetical protein
MSSTPNDKFMGAQILAHTAIADQVSKIQLTLPASPRCGMPEMVATLPSVRPRIGLTTGESWISATRKHREG